MANLRSAYAEQTANLLTWDGTSTITAKTVNTKQTQTGWQSGQPDIGGITNVAAVTSGSSWTVSADTTNNAVTISPLNP